MLDKLLIPIIHKPFHILGKACVSIKITALHLTLLGLPFAALTFVLILNQHFYYAFICILINRILDGLDGTVARITNSSSVSGAYLDIVYDYVFYALIPLGHGLVNMQANLLPTTIILFVYVLSGVNFMATSSAANKLTIESKSFAYKKIYYPINVIEGTETILYLSTVTLFPKIFPIVSYISAGILLLTLPFATFMRYKTFLMVENNKKQSVSLS